MNIPFSSPRYAISVLAGAQLNGRTEWEVETTNQTYADFQEELLRN